MSIFAMEGMATIPKAEMTGAEIQRIERCLNNLCEITHTSGAGAMTTVMVIGISLAVGLLWLITVKENANSAA